LKVLEPVSIGEILQLFHHTVCAAAAVDGNVFYLQNNGELQLV